MKYGEYICVSVSEFFFIAIIANVIYELHILHVDVF